MPSYPQGMIWLLLSCLTCQARQYAIEPSSPTMWLHRLSKKCSIIMWLGPPIPWKSWNSISSLFCMFISCFLHSLLAFSNSFFQNKKKYVSLFIIIRHELCYPPIYNPLMKLSSVLLRKSLHLSLYLLSYEYVCTNCLIFPCICSTL